MYILERDFRSDILYSSPEFQMLINATIATSAISIVSCILVIVFYICLRTNNANKANRVSLRCVFLASWMNLIYSIFDICSVIMGGDTAFCRSSAIITMFARVMSSALLAIVGINLVLVFVIHVSSRTASRLEWGYYFGALFYGFLTISVPISEEVKSPLEPDSPHRCYYHVYYYQIFGHSTLLWMWFYGLLFFTTITAMCCSIIASIKLMQEHHNLLAKFSTIANNSQTAEASNSHIEERTVKQSNIVTRVVSRCVVYPLVPFISNICGFIIQVMMVNPRANPPSFALAMADTILCSLQGFFIALVFFSDPTMSDFLCKGIRSWKEKYVDQYSKVCKYKNGEIKIVSPSTTTLPQEENDVNNTRLLSIPDIEAPLPTAANAHQRSDSLSSSINSSYFIDKKKRCESYQDSVSTIASTVPMRRIDVSPSIYSRISTAHNSSIALPRPPSSTYQGSVSPSISEQCNSTTKINTSRCFIDPESNNHQVLVPYKHPRLASFTHWCMKRCGIRSPESTIKQPDEQHGDIAITDLNSSSPNLHPLQREQ